MVWSIADAAAREAVELQMHDAVDLASQAVVTTPGTGSPTPQARLARLRHLGFPGDISIFGSPSHRLTAQAPYQASPEAWLDAFQGTYSAGPGVDQIWWRLPAHFAAEFTATCNATFRGLATGPWLLTVSVEVWPYTGQTGAIVIDIGGTRAEIPVSASSARTIDVAFTHDGSDPLTTMVLVRPGIYDFVVHKVTLGSPGIVVQQQPTA